MSNKYLRTIFFALSSAIAVSLLGSALAQSENTATQNNETNQGSIASRVQTDSQLNSWFCTFVIDGTYSDRKRLQLWDDRAGLMDEESLSWTQPGNTLVLQLQQTRYDIENIEFGRRLNDNDKFKGSVGTNSTINCDWVGPPRPGFFNDPVELPHAPSFTAGDVESTDILLQTNVRDFTNNRHWFCVVHSSENNPGADTYQFTDRLVRRGNTEGTWRVTTDTSIRMQFSTDNNLEWHDIAFQFSEGTNDSPTMSAEDNTGNHYVCELTGPPKAESY